MTDKSFAEIVALCQALPGPASSQVGIYIGHSRFGILGALIAWIGFTLPSAILMILAAHFINHQFFTKNLYLLHGLKLSAVVIITHALWSMWKSLANDLSRTSIALASFLIIYIYPSSYTQLIIILSAITFGFIWAMLTHQKINPTTLLGPPRHHFLFKQARISFLVFSFLLFFVPIIGTLYENSLLQVFNIFFRTGSLVFGGGHVVLPLLKSELISNNIINQQQFLDGYAFAQIIPGPLFSLSAFLGHLAYMGKHQLTGAIVALIAIFLPSFLIIIGIVPFWDKIKNSYKFQMSLTMVNACVVGILLSALIDPVIKSSILTLSDVFIVILGSILCFKLKWNSWKIVALCIALSATIQLFGFFS